MKSAKLSGFFALGILALLLAGCFNPITVTPPEQNNPTTDPFTVDILIGKDTEESRSIAGPDAERIKNDIRNIIQLIVTDDSGNIVAFDEVRREKDSDTEALLWIKSIPFGPTYHFLLLMGHWERDYDAESGGSYVYKEDNPPTLLAAGLKDQPITGSGKITVSMWPVVIDTEFSSGTQSQPISPVVTMGRPEEVKLLPVDWDVTWTIKRGLSDNGLIDLVRAQKVLNSGMGDALLLKSTPQTMVRDGVGPGDWDNGTLTGNTVTRSIGAYTSGFQRIGKEGSVNFKLEYVPFHLTGGETNPWADYDGKSVFDLSGGKEPVWIIRNGITDEAQDENTDFTAFHNIGNPGMKTANGNGAVRYKITAKTPAEGSKLEVNDGVFLGPSGSTAPEITFTTGGYTGDAEVYYAVKPQGANLPDYSEYRPLDKIPAGDHRETIEIPAAGGDYDVYVIVYKDAEVSDPEIINTKKGSEGIDWIWGDDLYSDIEWIWGEDPYKGFYVASYGDDGAAGTKEAPLKTVEKALANLASAYAADTSWPQKGTGIESAGAIIILDTVNAAQQITIDNTGSIYPPVILCGDPEILGEKKLQARTSITGVNKSLLQLQNNAKVILYGGLILAGTGNVSDNIRGVYVSGSVFIISDGKISRNSSSSTSNGGGGVYVDNSTFIMSGGEISENTSSCWGGGVFLESGTFIMSGGKISGNTAANGGGGVYFSSSSNIIKKTGGTIYGYDSAAPDDPYSNKVKGTSGIIPGKGHAVYYDSTHRKETTAGPGDNLFYADPVNGTSGW
jgi:hypothetical protein